MKSLPTTPDLLKVARRVVWFKEPEEALSEPVHFLAHVMTYGTVEDLKVLQGVAGVEEFREVLENAPAGVFDAIVSNPPFFVDSLKNPDSKRTMARHTDSLPFRDLFAGVKRLLSDEGVFSAIVPVEVVEQFVAESCILGFYLIRKCGVKTVERKQSKRFMLSFAKHRISPYEEHVETMMDSQGNRSEWYRKITEEFYLF